MACCQMGKRSSTVSMMRWTSWITLNEALSEAVKGNRPTFTQDIGKVATTLERAAGRADKMTAQPPPSEKLPVRSSGKEIMAATARYVKALESFQSQSGEYADSDRQRHSQFGSRYHASEGDE